MAMDFLPTAYSHMTSTRVSVNTSSATALRCGSSNQSGRKLILIDNTSNVPIFIGSEYASDTSTIDGTPTTITAYFLGKRGIKMASGDRMWLPVSDNITVYARSNSGVKEVRVTEFA